MLKSNVSHHGAGRVAARTWTVGVASLGVVAGGLLVVPSVAKAVDPPCSGGLISTSMACTLPSGYSIEFTIKGGNGGSGSTGGTGGSGGNANNVPGG